MAPHRFLIGILCGKPDLTEALVYEGSFRLSGLVAGPLVAVLIGHIRHPSIWLGFDLGKNQFTHTGAIPDWLDTCEQIRTSISRAFQEQADLFIRAHYSGRGAP